MLKLNLTGDAECRLTLVDTTFVTPSTPKDTPALPTVACATSALDVPVTEAARAFLGMAPRNPAKIGPPPAVFVDDTEGVRVVHRELRLRFCDDTGTRAANALLREFGLKRVKGRKDDESTQIVTVKSSNADVHGAELIGLSNALNACEEVQWCTPHFVSSYARQMPQVFKAPSAAWHLPQILAPQAWAFTQGQRVVVAVIDDGVDVDHRNLATRLRLRPDRFEPRDRYGRDFFVDEDTADHFNPRPKSFSLPSYLVEGNDLHGTACAGLVAAEGHPMAGPFPAIGVAPRARILPVKIFHGSKYVADSRVAAGIRYAGTFADILSCSWTTSNNVEVNAAISDVTTNGRSGRGCPMVVATGNHAASVIAFPASHPATIAVGAITENGSETDYANFGAGVDVCAPSSGGPRGIYTTDWSIPGRGLNPNVDASGGHTDAFVGTSAACPQVAGVIALMLARKPSLDVNAVREILRATADRIGFAGIAPHAPHPKFGYGRVNALAAVKAALAR